MSAPMHVLFDDFAYRDSSDDRLARRGWTIRSGTGGPGEPGATWSTAAVTFPAVEGKTVLQLESATDGTASGTVQAEVFHQRKFREGTYAARVRFSNGPTSGPRGDQVVQAFFTISPLAHDGDPDYSELDIEYLQNGGWGERSSFLSATSWETYGVEPGLEDNTQTKVRGSYAGWHDLTIQVADRRIRYFVDGRIIAEHGERYYPETVMSINVNQWFVRGGLLSGPAHRSYCQLIDFVYFAKDRVLTPGEVAAEVAGYRADSVAHVDTV